MKASDKELLRYALADHAFREADALAQHIIESKFSPDSHVVSAALAGVVVCYCRPFMSATGLGPLPQAMQRFDGEKEEVGLRTIHEHLMEARHKLAAHFDRDYSEEKHKSGVLLLPPSEVTVELKREGFVVATNAAYMNPDGLPMARALFAFQMERVKARLGSIAVAMLSEHKKLGKFVFKVS